MIDPEPGGLGTPSSAAEPIRSTSAAPDRPLSTLRGARVDVDGRRVARVLVLLVLVSVLVLVGVLAASGASKNANITALRANGVPVEVTVTSCRGLMGGSGSNLVGYACSGDYHYGGHRYDLSIPGDAQLAPQSRLAAVALVSNPSVATTTAALAGEQPSWRVFIAPAAILLVLGAGASSIWWWRRARGRGATASAPGG